MKRAILVIGLLGLLICTGYGQMAPLKANIPFDFVVAGTSLPAGTYELKTTEFNFIQIENMQTKKTVSVQILARLGTGGSSDSKLTFDVIGEKKVLETIQPANEDGYLFKVTKGKHTHQVVKVS